MQRTGTLAQALASLLIDLRPVALAVPPHMGIASTP